MGGHRCAVRVVHHLVDLGSTAMIWLVCLVVFCVWVGYSFAKDRR